jgi:hypothetical protein
MLQISFGVKYGITNKNNPFFGSRVNVIFFNRYSTKNIHSAAK